MIADVAARILDFPPWLALVLVFALPALESSAFIGFIFPGEIALVLGGVLAFEGKVALGAVLLAGITGAALGDSIGYGVGRRHGRRVLDGIIGRWINHKHFDRAESVQQDFTSPSRPGGTVGLCLRPGSCHRESARRGG